MTITRTLTMLKELARVLVDENDNVLGGGNPIQVGGSITTTASGTTTVDGTVTSKIQGLEGKTSTYQDVRLDASTLTMQTIDYPHHEVHGGSSFIVSDYATVNDGATRRFLITTPNTTKWAHLVFQVSGTLITTVDLYENPTNVTGGTAMTEYNRNRNSATAATVTVTHTPAVVDKGSTIIFTQKYGLAAGGGANRIAFGGTSRAEEEFVLKQNEQYLLEITSGADGNIVSTVLEWYEHTDKV